MGDRGTMGHMSRVQMVNHALVWLLAAAVALLMAQHVVWGQDAHAYWLAGRRDEMYAAGPEEADAFLYSPTFAQFVGPLALLPWPVFYAVWLLLEGAALAWLVWPLPIRWRVPAAIACLPELFIGNIFLLLAAMAAAGVRRASPWIFGALTKVSTGVGAIWFGVRRDWHELGRAGAILAAIIWASVGADPGAWADWYLFLRDHGDGISPLMLARWVAAIGLVVWGAATWHPWTLAVALFLALPLINALACFAVLAALPRLVRISQPLPVGIDQPAQALTARSTP